MPRVHVWSEQSQDCPPEQVPQSRLSRWLRDGVCWVQTDIGHSGWGCLHIHAEVLMVQQHEASQGLGARAVIPALPHPPWNCEDPRIVHPNWPSGASWNGQGRKTEHLPCVKYFISQFVNLTHGKTGSLPVPLSWIPNTRGEIALTSCLPLTSNPTPQELRDFQSPLTDHPCQDYWILTGHFRNPSPASTPTMTDSSHV